LTVGKTENREEHKNGRQYNLLFKQKNQILKFY